MIDVVQKLWGFCRWIVSPTHGRRVLEKLAYGSGKPGLNLDNLRDIEVALPPLAEQRRIVAAVLAKAFRGELV